MDAWHDILDAATVQRIKTYSAFNDAESKNLMVQTAMEAGYELFKKESEKIGLVLQSDIDDTIKQNFELKEELNKYKNSYDEYCQDSISRKGYVCPANNWNPEIYEKSAAEICPECDHYNKDCIVYGKKRRKRDDLVTVKKQDLNLDWYRRTKQKIAEEESDVENNS